MPGGAPGHLEYQLLHVGVFRALVVADPPLTHSPVVLGPATLLLFLLLVFSSSFIVTFFLPELSDSTLAPEPPTFEPEPIHSWSVSFGTLGAASDIIRTSVRAFADLAKQVEDVEVVQEDHHALPQGVHEDARHGTRTNGRFKSTVRMHAGRNKKHKSVNQSHVKTKQRDPRTAYSPSTDGPSLFVRLMRRFLLGISLVGIVSFISLLLSLSLLAPFQVFRFHLFGNQRNNRNQGGLDVVTILVIGFVIIGVVK
jgi:hypothetical protein